MRKAPFFALAAVGSALIAWQAASAWQNDQNRESATQTTAAPSAVAVAPKTDNPARAAPTARVAAPNVAQEPSIKAVTPMPQRVATIGLLNKRNGLWRDLTLKPGQAVRIGDVVVRLKACETTAPWEAEAYTGAFVQLIVLGSDEKWRKIFSGWLYKESPSLNLVEHPIYDVWTKACTMRHPDTGPETLVVRGGDSRVSNGSSKARKSPDVSGDTAPASRDNAADSNTI
jgi:hypothetical protein